MKAAKSRHGSPRLGEGGKGEGRGVAGTQRSCHRREGHGRAGGTCQGLPAHSPGDGRQAGSQQGLPDVTRAQPSQDQSPRCFTYHFLGGQVQPRGSQSCTCTSAVNGYNQGHDLALGAVFSCLRAVSCRHSGSGTALLLPFHPAAPYRSSQGAAHPGVLQVVTVAGLKDIHTSSSPPSSFSASAVV